jgi:hypothetical protein
LLQLYPCYYTLHIILFLHLLSTNHKCTQPCYFPLLLKPDAQKLKKNWNTLMWSSLGERLPLVDCLWCYDVFLLQCFREYST